MIERVCPECGKSIAGSPSFCVNCGAKLPEGDRQGTTPDTVIVSGEATGAGTGRSRGPLPESFGRYRVLREVGRGAMGVVYLARDDRIERNVAIKSLYIDDRLPDDEQREIRARFEREATAAGQLSHMNIVTVFDVGDRDGVPYIAMEYLEGATLTEAAAEAPLTIPRATSVVEQVLSALSYAHSHGVVHRDIKPDNVFLLPDGTVKVADFGIARTTSSSTMTQAGQVMGTPGYMSPEQVKGEAVGPASDIFSTGVLLYELLTGAPAFSSTSPTSIMYKIVHEEPKPAHLLNAGIPPNLEAVIARATQKNAALRYASASEMKADIQSGAMPPAPEERSAHDGTVLRPAGVAGYQAPPVPVRAAGRTDSGKKVGIVIGAVGGALVLAGVAVALLLLFTRGPALNLVSPRSGRVTSPVDVKVDVKDPSRVARVEVSVDNEVRETLEKAPFETSVKTGAGTHSITVSAYDKGNRVLGARTVTVEAEEDPAAEEQDLTGMLASVLGPYTVDPGSGQSYPPQQIHDNQEVTCWAADIARDPNPVLTFTFSGPVVVTSVRAIPGYKKFSDVDRYLQNPKPSQLTLTFDDGSSQVVNFDRAPGAAALGWQERRLDKPVETTTVRVAVTGIYPGESQGGGHSASRDLSISELHFIGRQP